jgi:hypothetical protein
VAYSHALTASTLYSETQVHVDGGTNEARYPVRQDGFDNSSQTPNSTATSATLNPSRSFMFVLPLFKSAITEINRVIQYDRVPVDLSRSATLNQPCERGVDERFSVTKP